MSARAEPGTGAGALPSGTVVGDRFRVQKFLRAEPDTDVYQALDVQGGAMITLRLFGCDAAVRANLEADVNRAAMVAHRNLTATLAVGEHRGALFLACEHDEGHTLRELIDAKRAEGQTIGPAYAQTLLGHVVHALAEAHKVLAHGGLNPETIRVTRAGRVKVGDLGLVQSLPALVRRGGPSGSPPGVYAAPEVLRGQPPAVPADIYSLGAILYELLTGVPPTPSAKAVSTLRPELPKALDGVISWAMAPQPHARFAAPAALLEALGSALDQPPAAAQAPPAPQTVVPAPPTQPEPPPGPVRLGRSFDVAQAAGLTAGDERWLVQKDRLDYGPFSLQHIMSQIEIGVFSSEDVIVEVDSGERQRIKEHPLLGEFSVEAEHKLEAIRRAQADHVHEKVERKKFTATSLIVTLAVAALGVALTWYLKNRKAAEADVLATRVSEWDVNPFLKSVKFIFVEKQRAAGGARRPVGGRDHDFSGNLNLGDVSQGGGDEILGDDVIQRVMMGNYRKLVTCIMAERRRTPGLHDVEIEFVVLGSGKVSAVRVNGQRQGSFPACVLGRMQSFGFPSYNGRRTIASWSLSMR